MRHCLSGGDGVFEWSGGKEGVGGAWCSLDDELRVESGSSVIMVVIISLCVMVVVVVVVRLG